MVSIKFPRAARLLNSKQFQSVFDQVDFKVSNKNLLILSSKNDLLISRLGLIVSKKKISKAVDRNRVKRVARESYRLNQRGLAGLDIIVLPRHNLGALDNRQLRALFDLSWGRLSKKAQKEILK